MANPATQVLDQDLLFRRHVVHRESDALISGNENDSQPFSSCSAKQLAGLESQRSGERKQRCWSLRRDEDVAAFQRFVKFAKIHPAEAPCAPYAVVIVADLQVR